MTVLTEFAAEAGRIEFIIAIEGVGWPVTYTSLADGFNGNVWASFDFDGDLGTKMNGASGSCTVRKGFSFELASRSYNSRTGQFTAGRLMAKIVDGDDWWGQNYYPSASPTAGIALDSDLDYNGTTIDIDDGSGLSEGDVVWINGVEAVKLGTKSLLAGSRYRFTSSTRAYLGTPRGDIARMQREAAGFVWLNDTRVLDVHQVWYDRMVQVYAHVPGEASSNLLRVFSGYLRDIKTDATATEIRISAVGDPMVRPSMRVWKPQKMRAVPGKMVYPPHRPRGSFDTWSYSLPELGLKASAYLKDIRSTPGDDTTALAYAYRYRTEPGGTAGARDKWLNTDNEIQAAATQEDGQVIMRFLKIGDHIRLAEKAVESGATLKHDPANPRLNTTLETMDKRLIQLESWSSVGTNSPQISGQSQWEDIPEAHAHFLLANWFDAAEFNDYSVNGETSRNVVDVFLHHLLSRDDEYVIEDTTTGSTTTVVNFASAIAPSSNFYAGAALFCVEGNNKGESRVIVSNTTTSVTVEDAFSNAPASGQEYQIRNAVYDTLPVGWGLGIPWYNVDIDSFEDVRDKYLPDADCDRFLFGVNEKVDIWKVLQENILQAYGIAVTVSATTGKMTARYVGTPVGDTVDETYREITSSDILDVSDITYEMRPVSAVRLLVRPTDFKIVSFLSTGNRLPWQGGVPGSGAGTRTQTGYVPEMNPILEKLPATMGSDTHFEYIQASDVYGFNESELDTVELHAEFDSFETIHNLAPRAESIIEDFSKPKPYVTLRVSYAFLDVEIGDTVKVTSLDNIANPFVPGTDWVNVLGRVVDAQVNYLASDPGVMLTLELMTDVNGGRVAPACNLGGAFKGSDGTSDYFIVDPDAFVADAYSGKDYYTFAVGDRIEVRDVNGLTYGAVYTIRSFGANDVSDPTAASSDIVRVNETISPTLAAGDYITFSDWSASNTARMDLYAALADPTTELLAAADPARRYG